MADRTFFSLQLVGPYGIALAHGFGFVARFCSLNGLVTRRCC